MSINNLLEILFQRTNESILIHFYTKYDASCTLVKSVFIDVKASELNVAKIFDVG